MPRYYFHLSDNGTSIRDDEGTVLDDVHAARHDALKLLGERARDKLPDGDHRMFAIEVDDERNRHLLTANLSVMVTYAKRSRE